MIFWERLKSFSALYEKLTEPIREEYDLTQLEFDILMFLYNNPQYKTANDVVRVRRLAKSHVSTSVASLKKKGLLAGSYMEGNRKSIRLERTPAAAEIVSAGAAAQNAYGEILARGFSETEKEQFRELFLRICDNANTELERRL